MKRRWLIGLVGLALVLTACSADTASGEEASEENDDAEVTTTTETESIESVEEVHEQVEVSEQAEEGIFPACSISLEPGFQAGVYEVTIDEEVPEEGLVRTLSVQWDTDVTRRTIEFNEILSGGVGRDGIPPVYSPRFVSINDAEEWLVEIEPVVVLDVGGDVRAYPLQILTWHEIVNDEVCGVPVAVTYCPLCNSALVFDRRINGEVYKFGVSGLLRNSDLVMWDHKTESLWQQFTGEGIVGVHAGDQLGILPAFITSFEDFKAAYPEGIVLSRQTGTSRNYGLNPYTGYDTLDRRPFLFSGIPDPRLLPMRRVVGVTYEGSVVAYPFDVLAEERVVNDTVGGLDIVVFFTFGTNSALDGRSIAESQDIGAGTVFSPVVDGQMLTFVYEDGKFIDEQTGSQWGILGQAVAGEMEGAQLDPVVSSTDFWFAWAAFYPETVIYGMN